MRDLLPMRALVSRGSPTLDVSTTERLRADSLHPSWELGCARPARLSRQLPTKSNYPRLPLKPAGLSIEQTLILATVILVFFVLVIVHQLSPYVFLAQLATLTFLGRSRPRWLILGLTAIAIGYFVPRFGYVESHYGLLYSLGHFFENLKPPSAALGTPETGVLVAAEAARILSLGMWALGLFGLWRRWRASEPTAVLAALAIAPVFVIFGGAYGGEAILRVYLFSIPWTACLAASALHVRRRRTGIVKVLGAPAVVIISLALFMPAFFGNDRINVMPRTQTDEILSFYSSAQPGTIFVGNSNFPTSLTERYNLFPIEELFGSGGLLGKKRVAQSDGRRITKDVANRNRTGRPSYVIITASMEAYAQGYDPPRVKDLIEIKKLLSQAPGWLQVHSSHDVSIYELPPSQ